MAVKTIKNIPNCITLIRALGAVGLLFTKPFSIPFFLLYIVCGLSDVLDGFLARKMKAVSKSGQVIDSLSDLFFICIVLAIFLPAVRFPMWAICWIAAIVAVRFASLTIGLAKYHKLAFLHTCANKAAGIALFLFPFLYVAFGTDAATVLTCSAASLSAIEELLINATSKVLQRDIKSIFHGGKNR